LQAQDEERRRIARELHDSTGQELVILTINLGSLRAKAEAVNSEISDLAANCENLARQISTELRTISYLLHPPLLDQMGLASAINWFVEGFKNKTDIDVALELPSNMERLPRDIETALFRIVQEALTNIHRHSGSSTAAISLQNDGSDIVLRIRDDGSGIPKDALYKIGRGLSLGVGLRGMRERVKELGGHMEVRSPGKGTELKFLVPVSSESKSWDD
jgi:signal transduction histidine kinase